VRAVGLRSAVAILIAGTGVGLAVGSANAEAAALAEREAPDSADSVARDATPTAGKAEQRRERQSQRGKEQLAHARVVLFDGIELSAEQSREVDAIVEAELKFGRRTEELRTELEAARRQGDTERIRAIGAERQSLLAQRKGPDRTMEEMRALLTEEQRPTFDMNRARLAAESQQPKKRRHKKGP
jgi:hypothetical protein